MKKRLGNNLGLKILAVLFSALLWLIVVNTENPVMTQVYTGVEVTVTHGEVITNMGNTYQISEETKTVSVTVRAKRSVLNRIKAGDIQATADMKNLLMRSMVPVTVTIPGFSYEEAVATPNNIEVTIDSNSSKKFPITPMTSGTLRDGYVLGEIAANPETITISGPEKVVDSISKVVAEVDVSGLSQGSELAAELILYDDTNTAIDPTLLTSNLGEEGVSVKVSLLNTKMVDLKFDDSEINTADDYAVSAITYEPQQVQVSGSKEVLDQIDNIYIDADALAVEGLTEKIEKTVDISSFLPEGVHLVDENSKNVAVKIGVEQLGTKTIDFPIGSIYLMNVADGMKASYGTVEDIEIKVRGPQEVLDELNFDKDKNQKTVSVNMVNYKQAGTYAVPLQIKLPDECSLVSDIIVNITLQQQ